MEARLARILGFLGGIFGLCIGLFAQAILPAVSAGGAPSGSFLQAIRIALPMVGLIGALLVISNAGVAAALLLLSSGALGWFLGLNAFTAIPLLLIGSAAALALLAARNRATRSASYPDVTPAKLTELSKSDAQLMIRDARTERGIARHASSLSDNAAYEDEHAVATVIPTLIVPYQRDEKFRYAALAVGTIVALSAISVGGILGWKYLESATVVSEAKRRPPSEEQQKTRAPQEQSVRTDNELKGAVPEDKPNAVVGSVELSNPGTEPPSELRSVRAPATKAGETADKPPPRSAAIRESSEPVVGAKSVRRPEPKTKIAAMPPVQSFRGEPADWHSSLVDCCVAYCRMVGCNSPPLPKACSPELLALEYYPGDTIATQKRSYLIGAKNILGKAVFIAECQ